MVSVRSLGERKHAKGSSQCNWAIVLGYISVVALSALMFSQHAGELLNPSATASGSDNTYSSPKWRLLKGKAVEETEEKYAYVTELHHGTGYLCGAAMLAWNLRTRGEDIDLVALVSGHLGETYEEHQNAISYLKELGFKVHSSPLLKNPFHSYMTKDTAVSTDIAETKRENYSKINMFALHEYSKIIYLDADIFLPNGAPDQLFDKYEGAPKPAGRRIHGHGINSGMMVVRPDVTMYLDMLSKISEVTSYNGGDQGFLINYFNTFGEGFEYFQDDHVRQEHNQLPPNSGLGPEDRPDAPRTHDYEVYHAFGKKIWQCPRDHYCEKNPTAARKYLWPQMEDLWWKNFDDMVVEKPFVVGNPKFRDYCIQPDPQGISEKHQSDKWGYILPKKEMIKMRETKKATMIKKSDGSEMKAKKCQTCP
mmetsp:Transcript_11388/g.27485  ORF Transcript_11388/g.27485 Transcript_11388/m.27485 type:complete len:422 (-) Transcript_11388:405-1670(-)